MLMLFYFCAVHVFTEFTGTVEREAGTRERARKSLASSPTRASHFYAAANFSARLRPSRLALSVGETSRSLRTVQQKDYVKESLFYPC